MPDTRQTIGDLYKAKAVSEEQLEAAVDAFMRDPSTHFFRIAEDIVIDPAAAVRASEHARAMLAMADIKKASKRSAVRSAILLSRPVRT